MDEKLDDYKLAKMYVNKVNNAKAAQHEFSLTFAQYKKIMTRKTCPVLGIKLQKTGTQPFHPQELTLDRIDSSKGYIMGNVIAMSYKANQIKSLFEGQHRDMSDAIKFGEWLKSQGDK